MVTTVDVQQQSLSNTFGGVNGNMFSPQPEQPTMEQPSTGIQTVNNGGVTAYQVGAVGDGLAAPQQQVKAGESIFSMGFDAACDAVSNRIHDGMPQNFAAVKQPEQEVVVQKNWTDQYDMKNNLNQPNAFTMT